MCWEKDSIWIYILGLFLAVNTTEKNSKCNNYATVEASFYAVVRYIKSNFGFRRKMYCLYWRVHFGKYENQATCGISRITESPYNYWSSLCCPSLWFCLYCYCIWNLYLTSILPKWYQISCSLRQSYSKLPLGFNLQDFCQNYDNIFQICCRKGSIKVKLSLWSSNGEWI